MSMEQLSGGQLVAKSLKAEGVTHVFTLCGGHVTPIYKACADEGMRIIDMRHEQAVVMAADGFARQTRQPAVALVTAGPGVTNALTGLANAYRAQSPVVVLGGRSPFASFDMGALQDMNHNELVKPITKWSRTVLEPRRLPEYISMAFRHAYTGVNGPVFLELPMDILWGFAEVSPAMARTRTKARAHGDPAHVELAAKFMREAKRPAIIAGSSVWWHNAEEDLVGFAERASSPVYTNGMARGTVPPDHPLFLNLSRRDALSKADVVVVVGTPFDFRLGYGKAPALSEKAKIIQIDLDPSLIGQNRAVDVGIVGDSKAVLRQLNECLATDALDDSADRDTWISSLREAEAQKRAEQEEKTQCNESPPSGYRLCREIADVIDDQTIVIGDGGDIVAVGAKIIPARRPGSWMDPGPFGCLGVGQPFAIAAKLAHPDKKVILLSGDGAFGLNGFEVDTAVRHNLPFVTVVGNDAGWGQIRSPQKSLYGADCTVATDLAPTRYDKVVSALGGWGEHVDDPDKIGPALRRAIDSGLPACVNVEMQPDLVQGQGYMRGL